MLRYNGTTIGKVVIKQQDKKFTIQIRQGNCLAVLVHVRKLTDEERKEDSVNKYRHTLYTFFADEQHMKNILKHEKSVFGDENVVRIELNLFYKECKTLLKYFALSGHKVTCYYKEPKKK